MGQRWFFSALHPADASTHCICSYNYIKYKMVDIIKYIIKSYLTEFWNTYLSKIIFLYNPQKNKFGFYQKFFYIPEHFSTLLCNNSLNFIKFPALYDPFDLFASIQNFNSNHLGFLWFYSVKNTNKLQKKINLRIYFIKLIMSVENRTICIIFIL